MKCALGLAVGQLWPSVDDDDNHNDYDDDDKGDVDDDANQANCQSPFVHHLYSTPL